MTEEQVKKTEDTKQEPQKKTMVDLANEAAERLEKANERMAELVAQQERLSAENKLAGFSEGPAQETGKKEETNAEYAKRISSGNY